MRDLLVRAGTLVDGTDGVTTQRDGQLTGGTPGRLFAATRPLA